MGDSWDSATHLLQTFVLIQKLKTAIYIHRAPTAPITDSTFWQFYTTDNGLKYKERLLNYLFVDRYVYFAILNFHLKKNNKEKNVCMHWNFISPFPHDLVHEYMLCYELLLLLQVFTFGGGDGFRKLPENCKIFLGKILWITFKRCHIVHITHRTLAVLKKMLSVMGYLISQQHFSVALQKILTNPAIALFVSQHWSLHLNQCMLHPSLLTTSPQRCNSRTSTSTIS